jgi:type I restriction enzyme S subunit
MFVQKIDEHTLTTRLDPGFYSPEGLEAHRAIINFGSFYSLKEIVNPERAITNGVRGPDLVDSKYKLVRLQDCVDWSVNFSTCERISEEQFRENRRCQLKKDDIVVAIGGYVGNASLVQYDDSAVIWPKAASRYLMI